MFEEGAYTTNIKRRLFRNQSFFRNLFRKNFGMTLDRKRQRNLNIYSDHVVSEPEEMTDDDSDFSPLELKIEFIPRKFIQFTLFELLFSFIFLDLGGGGLYDEHTVNQQFPFQNWGGGLIRRGLICRNIR